MLAAQVSLGRKDPAKAIQQLETAQKSEPNNPALHYWEGVAYRAQGNLDLAQQSLEQAIGLNQHYTDANLALADLMFAKGLSDSALAYAQQALQQDQNRAEAHLLAGKGYYNLRKFDEAEKEFQKFVEMQPNSPQGPLRLGAVHLMQRRYDIAQKDFEKSLTLNPKQDDALNGVVTIYRLKGQNDKAIARIRQQIAVVETADIYNLLAKTYLDLGQTDPAEKSLKRALELDPQSYNTCALFGTLYMRQNALDKAAAEFEAALQVNPRQVGAWTVLGMIEKQRGDFDKAQQAYQKALAIDPNAGIAANNLASLYCEGGGDLDAALDLARRARQALPKSPVVSDTLGWVYYKRQLYDSAIPVLQEAVRDEPKNGEYRFHLAASLLGAGKKQQAQTELNTALKLNNDLRKRPDVQQVLSQLTKG
jgi:tetratricopeptide (TPR) repeat protein